MARNGGLSWPEYPSGRQMHPNKRGKIELERRCTLNRLGLTDDAWTTQVKATESDFHRAIGATDALIDCASQIGQRWLQGVGVARGLRKLKLTRG